MYCGDPLARDLEVVVVEVEVQQVDVPRRLDGARDVGAATIARAIGSVVVFESSWTSRFAGAEQLVVLLVEQALEQRRA